MNESAISAVPGVEHPRSADAHHHHSHVTGIHESTPSLTGVRPCNLNAKYVSHSIHPSSEYEAQRHTPQRFPTQRSKPRRQERDSVPPSLRYRKSVKGIHLTEYVDRDSRGSRAGAGPGQRPSRVRAFRLGAAGAAG